MSRFQKGQSGNPKGKPRGCKHGSTKLRDAITNDLHAIVAVMIDKAKGGDTAAAALLFSRTLPPLRPQSEASDVQLNGKTLNERAESIAAATLAGQISTTTAGEMMTLLTQQARIIETSELAERLERIEAALKIQ